MLAIFEFQPINGYIRHIPVVAPGLHTTKADALSLFPHSVTTRREGTNKMKAIQKILFMAAVVVGLSISASAQKHNGPKRPPPKDNPPVVTPNVKPPKGDERPPRRPRSQLLAVPKDLIQLV